MFQHTSEELRDNKETISAVVKIDGCMLKYASDRLKDDNYIVYMAGCNTLSALSYASKRIIEAKSTERAILYCFT